jgi:hypothetical protein
MQQSAIVYKRIVQTLVLLAGFVPVLAGGSGALFGAQMLGEPATLASLNAESHYRYLSGLLLGIGLVFWASIPNIERHAARFQILTLIVFIGGLARAWSAVHQGLPGNGMVFGLIMELVVTPSLCFAQYRLSRHYQRA